MKVVPTRPARDPLAAWVAIVAVLIVMLLAAALASTSLVLV